MSIKNVKLLLKQFAIDVEEDSIKLWIETSGYKFNELHISNKFAVLETNTEIADNVRIIIDRGNIQFIFKGEIDFSLIKDLINGMLINSEVAESPTLTWTYNGDIFLEKKKEDNNLNYLFNSSSMNVQTQFVGFQYNSSMQQYKVGLGLNKKFYKCSLRTDFITQDVETLEELMKTIYTDINEALVPEIDDFLKGENHVD